MSTQTVSRPQPRLRRASRPAGAVTAIDHALLVELWALVRAGKAVADDVTGQPIRGIEHYADLLDLDAPVPLSSLEHVAAHASGTGTSTAIDLEVTIRALLAGQPAPAGAGDADAGALVAALRLRERTIKATALIAQHVRDTPR